MALAGNLGGGGQPQPRVVASPLAGQPGDGSDYQLDQLRKRNEIMKLQAASQGPKQTLATGYSALGLSNGPAYTGLDSGSMNAIERDLYLPKNSTMEDPTREAAAAGMRDENERRADDAFNAMVQRRRAVDQTGGGPAYGGLR
jgi:hypothetical protein